MQQDGLEPRVSALEARVDQLTDRVRAGHRDAADARVLASAADRDTSDFRSELRDFRKATIASFNALREDMTDGFARVDEQFAGVDEQFARVNEQFARVDEQFARVNEQFARVNEQFARVDDGFIEIRGRLDGTAAGQEHIVGLLQSLIDRKP